MKFYILSTKGAYQSTDFGKFHLSNQNSEILHIDGLLLYKVLAKKGTEELSLMQSLKKN